MGIFGGQVAERGLWCAWRIIHNDTKAMRYSLSKKLTGLDYVAVVEKAKDALKAQGFGVLTEIDVAATLKKKLDIEYGKYTILGVCNPALAHKALEAEKEIGLFLPCNVIVYEQDGAVVVSGIMPTVAMNMLDNAELSVIASRAEEKMRAAIDAI